MTGGMEHPEPGGRIDRVAQQGGLADSGFPVNDDRAAATAARTGQDPIEYRAFVSPPEHHVRSLA